MVLASNMADDPICSEPDHTGYTYTGSGTPPLTFDPEDLPANLSYEGQLGTNFDCLPEPSETCHWVYVPASGQNPAKWVQCSGEIDRITPPAE